MPAKICTKCGTMTDDYGPDKRASDGLQSSCRACARARNKKFYYDFHDEMKLYKRTTHATYYSTKHGYLNRLFHAFTWRCNCKKSYLDKGIRNKFLSPVELVDHVINELQVDPRGLECHRIDDDGHYEKGNVKFLRSTDHILEHVTLRRMKDAS